MLNRGILTGVYGLTVLLGLFTVLFPAPSIWGVVGLNLTYLYGILLLVGALGALIAVLKPNYKLEVVFLWPVLGGYLIYDIALWGLVAERIALHDGLPLPYGPAIVAAVLSLFLFAKILLLIRKNHNLVKAFDNNGMG